MSDRSPHMSMTGYSVHDLDPHAVVVRYMCRVCKKPLGFPPPPMRLM